MTDSQLQILIRKLEDMQRSLLRLHEENMAMDRRLDKLERIRKDNRINLFLIGMIAFVMLSLKFNVSGTVGGLTIEGGKEDNTSALPGLIQILSTLGVLGTAGAVGYQVLKKEGDRNDSNDL